MARVSCADMPKKKPSKKKRSSKKRSNKKRKLLQKYRYYLVVGVVLFLSCFIYIGILDFEIRTQFEGKKWSLPARVYARSLDLYPGLQLKKSQFLQELSLLNYEEGLAMPGTYQELGKSVLVNTRGFQYWDKYEAESKLKITFEDTIISNIADQASGETISLKRLEPLQIASIYPAHKEDRDLIKLDDAPKLLVDTLLAVEDREFFDHMGVKPLSILRALIANIRAGAAVQGGSTLTQQLVKNFFLSNERTLRRKAIEAVMALLLEAHYDKNEILETYLNEIYLGQDGERAIHGFALASHFYFDQPLDKLQPKEIALLVGMVKGPSYYDPRRHPERIAKRRNLVLDIMERDGLINADVAVKARISAIKVKSQKISKSNTSYPAFIELVKRQLNRDYRDEDLKTEGLRIFTTLNPLLQHHAEQAVTSRLSKIEKQRGLTADSLQSAVVITATDSGEVVAVVGDRNTGYDGFNRALDAHRPIGSLVKPVVYLEALSRKEEYNALSLLDDSPIEVEDRPGNVWIPENFDHTNHGDIPLYIALAFSYNVATARLGLTLGVDTIVDSLKKLGVQKSIQPYPSVLLGALELSPYEVSQIYQTLAANGFQVPLKSVRVVLTVDGVPLQHYPLHVQQTLQAEPVYVLNGLLQKVVEMGTANSVGRQLPELKAAGKTGTSDDFRDSWFAGFTGSHLAVVWVGRDDNKPMKLTGSAGALPIWVDMMKKIQPRPLLMAKPAKVERIMIDVETGNRSNGKCEKEFELPFIIGTAPDKITECRRKSFFHRLFD